MFAYRERICKPLPTLVIVLALIACLPALGCGSPEESDAPSPAAGSAEGQDPGSGPQAEDPAAAEPEVSEADPADVEVITSWLEALSEGDTEGAARYFAIPSFAENGPRFDIRSLADAVAFNETLPCGAELLSAETVGVFTTATFRLLERPGGDCGAGTGGEASTSFVIEDRHIVEWRRLGTEPPGQGAPGEQGSIT
jgi:hypothetical protein